jgi:hypothetical protein
LKTPTKFRPRILAAGLFGAAIAMYMFSLTVAHATTQQSEPQTAQSQPKLQPPSPKGKLLEFKGVVMTFSTASITLRSQSNERIIQSFSYTPQLHDKVVALMQKGGYQNGDKVTIKYAADTTVAQSISGKPSKPKHF